MEQNYAFHNYYSLQLSDAGPNYHYEVNTGMIAEVCSKFYDDRNITSKSSVKYSLKNMELKRFV